MSTILCEVKAWAQSTSTPDRAWWLYITYVTALLLHFWLSSHSFPKPWQDRQSAFPLESHAHCPPLQSAINEWWDCKLSYIYWYLLVPAKSSLSLNIRKPWWVHVLTRFTVGIRIWKINFPSHYTYATYCQVRIHSVT